MLSLRHKIKHLWKLISIYLYLELTKDKMTSMQRKTDFGLVLFNTEVLLRLFSIKALIVLFIT